MRLWVYTYGLTHWRVFTYRHTHTECTLTDTHTHWVYTYGHTHWVYTYRHTHTECTLRTHTQSGHLTLTAEVLLDLGAMYSWSPPPMELSRPGLERERSCLLGEVGGVTCSSLMESGDPVGRRWRVSEEVDTLMSEGALIVGSEAEEPLACNL